MEIEVSLIWDPNFTVHFDYYDAIKEQTFIRFSLIKTGYALADANKSIELDSRYIKGYYRYKKSINKKNWN